MRDGAIRDCLQALAMLIAEGAKANMLKRIHTLIGAFVWSKESHEIVIEASDKAWDEIHLNQPKPWYGE